MEVLWVVGLLSLFGGAVGEDDARRHPTSPAARADTQGQPSASPTPPAAPPDTDTDREDGAAPPGAGVDDGSHGSDTDDVEQTDSDTPSLAGAKGDLERGLIMFDAVELDQARAYFEKALKAERAYTLEQVITLYASVGITRAYLDDEEGAAWAFERLLAIAPGHALPYTTSPKATFVFQRVKDAYKTRRTTELRLDTPAVTPFGAPITLRLTRTGDPLGALSTVVIKHRLKGAETFQKLRLPAPALGKSLTVDLPPVDEKDAFVDEGGARGALVEVAVSGLDKRGWEIFEGPSQTRPIEVPVGLDAPGPWYTEWWVYASGGSVAVLGTALAVGVTTAVVAAIFLQPPPERIPVDYQLTVEGGS